MPLDETLKEKVRLPHHDLHRERPLPQPLSKPITVVWTSDTPGTQPPIPPGDLLLRAFDLTQRGGFTEIPAQLDWLSAQPHKYKVAIAGNHDLLPDSDSQLKHPLRWQDALEGSAWALEHEHVNKESEIVEALDRGGVVYLRNTSTTSVFGQNDGEPKRTITICAFPFTPEHGLCA
ncbi:MAG: hypothetical protein LQ346_006322, partial [Caloplaca aetnensis]